MEKLIFLIETDDGLRENITELLELEGYWVKCLTLKEAKNTFKSYHVGLLIFNMLTLDESIPNFIKFIKNKVDGIVVLCSDEDDSQIDEVDIKIALPFDYHKLILKLSNFMNSHTLSA